MKRTIIAASIFAVCALAFVVLGQSTRPDTPFGPPPGFRQPSLRVAVLPGFSMPEGDIETAVRTIAASRGSMLAGYLRSGAIMFSPRRGSSSEQQTAEFEKAFKTALSEYANLPPDQLRQKVADVDAKIEQTRARLTMLKALAEARTKLWPEVLLEQVKSANLETQRLEMDLRAKTARAGAIREQLAEAEKKADMKADRDPVIGLLKKTLELRQQELQQVQAMVKTALAPRTEQTRAEAAVAEAEIQMLKRMETVKQGAAGDLVDRLTSELAGLNIDLVEMQVRLDFIRQTAPPLDVNRLDKATLDRLAQEYKPWYEAERSLSGEITKVRDEERGLLVEKFKLVVRIAPDAEQLPKN